MLNEDQFETADGSEKSRTQLESIARPNGCIYKYRDNQFLGVIPASEEVTDWSGLSNSLGVEELTAVLLCKHTHEEKILTVNYNVSLDKGTWKIVNSINTVHLE